MNSLANEKSPYLLQHAHNPVNWFTWSGAAFSKAKAEEKPIFLSIGYSTCHWCHVMAHESFEDEEVAQILNRDFISVKVDREERPDVDAVYMRVCQALTGSGGWPLTVIMTPEQKPFWAGTYLPKTSRYGRMGLTELLTAIAAEWKCDKNAIISSGEQIVSFLNREENASLQSAPVNKEILLKAYQQFRQSYDAVWGGFGSAPKFPSAHNLSFLIRYAALEKEKYALDMAEHTLTQMFRGGMFDHIGGGFSRYSTDEKWLVPHFEKMLYDNALLAAAYAEAYQATKNVFYRLVAERVLGYILRELTDGAGGFYCGQDADSDGVEGKYYLFTPEEISQALEKPDAELFCRRFDITERGNFEGKNIPNLIANPDFKEESEQIKTLCEKLRAYREKRARLHKDDKILTSWNALAITAFAKAARQFDKPEYLDAALKAERFITDRLTDKNGRLFVRWRDGETAHAGQLDDYAFYALALLEIYKNNFDAKYLKKAVFISEKMLELFFDEENGGFFMYAKDAEQLITRPKELYDGAMPSGNSAAAEVLINLFKLTTNEKWRRARDKHLKFLFEQAKDYPAGHGFFMLALTGALYPAKELICVLPDGFPAGLWDLLKECPEKNVTVLIITRENARALIDAAPFTTDYPLQKEPVYYLCQNGACSAPQKDLTALKNLIFDK
jgi:uncharacterized protein YyaL (SSP411 family)